MTAALAWLGYFAVFFLVAAAGGGFLLLRFYMASWRRASAAFPVPRLAWLMLGAAAIVLASVGASLEIARGHG
jgi:hypothetical protein